MQSLARLCGRLNSAVSNTIASLSSSSISRFHSLSPLAPNKTVSNCLKPGASRSLIQIPNVLQFQTRSVIKFSRYEGIRLSEEDVIKRFYRLDWGMWIHAKCGRHKKMWKKSEKQKRRLKQHVMCNATQRTLLDKMVNNRFKRKRYFVDDPYEPYHEREEFSMTSRKPRPLPLEAYSVTDTSP